MTILGERTEQLDICCRVTGFTSDFLSFIDVELIRFFHVAIQLLTDRIGVSAVLVLGSVGSVAERLRASRKLTQIRFLSSV